MEFIFQHDNPIDMKATYVQAVWNIKPQKSEHRQTILTAVGILVDYPGEVSTPTADLNTFKIHANSVISYIISRYMYMSVKYFYINNRMYWS